MPNRRRATPERPDDHRASSPVVHTRRDVLKLGAFVAGTTLSAPFFAACLAPGSPSASTGDAGSSSTSFTVITAGGDPTTQPGYAEVYEGFRSEHPGIDWDIRALTGAGPEWDRLARAALAAGEPVSLLMINGQQVRGWVRDGLLADLGADPGLADVLARVPRQFHFGDAEGSAVRAFPLGVTQGVHTTGLYYNQALLEAAGLAAPATFADLEAMVEPLRSLGVAPMVHCSGDVFFNQILLTWVLPMIAERDGDPVRFAEDTVRGVIGYDSAGWVEAFETIARLRSSGVLLDGSGATDYGTMQQLLLQGKVATTFNGTWMLPQLLAGAPTVDFDLHVAPPPLVEGATKPRPILAWTGFGLPVDAPARDAVYAFLEYASRPEVDRSVTAATQSYSPIASSNEEIVNEVAQEFLPLFDDAILPIDWLWEPEITAEIDAQVQALVRGTTDSRAAAAAVQSVATALRSSGRSYS